MYQVTKGLQAPEEEDQEIFENRKRIVKDHKGEVSKIDIFPLTLIENH